MLSGVVFQHRAAVRESALDLGGFDLPLAAVCGHLRGAAFPDVRRL